MQGDFFLEFRVEELCKENQHVKTITFILQMLPTLGTPPRREKIELIIELSFLDLLLLVFTGPT